VLAVAVLLCGSAGAATTQVTLAVWVVGVDGKGRTNLTADDPESLATSPSVSPNGKTIAYVHSDGRIWLMNADGTNKRPLGSEPGELQLDSGPTWSPSGRDVAYTLVRLVPGAECASWSIVVRDAGTGAVVAVFDDALTPTWAPLADRMAFESNAAHCEQPGSLGVATLNGARHQLPVKLGAIAPAWSPDGRRLAFYCWSTRIALCVVDADGRHLRRVSGGGPHDLDPPPPAWSPDSKKVAFTTAHGRTTVVTLSSARSRSLGLGTAPSWSPNGKWIATFTGSTLRLRDARTGKGRSVTRVEGPFRLLPPAWSPGGRRIYFTSSAE
jgi:Tol biopolymer transport system component